MLPRELKWFKDWTGLLGNKCKSRVNIDKMEQDYKPNIYLFLFLKEHKTF